MLKPKEEKKRINSFIFVSQFDFIKKEAKKYKVSEAELLREIISVYIDNSNKK